MMCSLSIGERERERERDAAKLSGRRFSLEGRTTTEHCKRCVVKLSWLRGQSISGFVLWVSDDLNNQVALKALNQFD